MNSIVINGQKVVFETGATLLEVARENGIKIPSLCDHPQTGPVGRSKPETGLSSPCGCGRSTPSSPVEKPTFQVKGSDDELRS